MKYSALMLVVLCLPHLASAQWLSSGNDIYKSNSGNIGIGIANPQSLTHIHGSRVASQLKITNAEAGGILSALSYSEGNTSLGLDTYYNGSGWVLNSSTGALLYKIADRIEFQGITGTIGTIVSPTSLFTVKISSGNVGIGTIAPTEKLSVNGKIRAHEVKVETTNWPDFVFEKSYPLLSLADLEKYIKINNHLPQIPSAREIHENGVNVGEMNSKLLQKIEELTIHLIELNKKVELQQQELELLKK